ncbi:hypothetical protein EDC01DRAFT_283057 [Geopyxis carbonaria]|nr:hypothetical protein EDC01DRAFT_283057 [Geopyxis carbonaria]
MGRQQTAAAAAITSISLGTHSVFPISKNLSLTYYLFHYKMAGSTYMIFSALCLSIYYVCAHLSLLNFPSGLVSPGLRLYSIYLFPRRIVACGFFLWRSFIENLLRDLGVCVCVCVLQMLYQEQCGNASFFTGDMLIYSSAGWVAKPTSYKKLGSPAALRVS